MALTQQPNRTRTRHVLSTTLADVLASLGVPAPVIARPGRWSIVIGPGDGTARDVTFILDEPDV